MCWDKIKNWWNSLQEAVPDTPTYTSRMIDIFAIGDYAGSGNDLVGPPYDVKNVKSFVESNYPDYAINVFSDAQVTRSNFKNRITGVISAMKSGDSYKIYYSGHGTNGPDATETDGKREGLYLYDGTLWDDDFAECLQDIPTGARVEIILDSCFAHGSTEIRDINSPKKKYVQTHEVPPGKRLIRTLTKAGMTGYIVISACQENQTSADLGTLGGAFTFYWIRAWERNMTWQQWVDKTAQAISQAGLVQIPNIDGDPEIINEIIFS